MQQIVEYNKLQDVVLTKENVTQINTLQAMYLQKGDILLVRSSNVPQLGDHLVIITGPIIEKPHGRRPETTIVSLPDNYHPLLDEYTATNGVTALKLNIKSDYYYRASLNPIKDIDKVSLPGLKPELKRFRDYSDYLNMLPRITENDPLLESKMINTKRNMTNLSINLSYDDELMGLEVPSNEFKRTIVAIESPIIENDVVVKEGVEIIVAHWGTGYTSPIHGHSPGYMHEEILKGAVVVNMFKQILPNSSIVRPTYSYLQRTGTFVSEYSTPTENSTIKRDKLIHSFTAISPTTSLHFLPEHTRNGIDNTFVVERFDPLGIKVRQLNLNEALAELVEGDVAIVRSDNHSEMGDHYIMITGPKEQKEHGFRQKSLSISAPDATPLLNTFKPIDGLIMLKMSPEDTARFIEFHDIAI